MGKALILTDGKAGHENQSKAFARALGLDFDLVEVHFKSKFHKALSYLLDHLDLHLFSLFTQPPTPNPQYPNPQQPTTNYQPTNYQPTNPQQPTTNYQQPTTNKPTPYAVVIGTGSGTFYAAKALARRLSVKCGVVLYPRGYNLKTFDCILAPTFDQPVCAANVIAIPANLVANDESFYAKGLAAFRERYAGATDNAVAVIVGGPNARSTMTPAWMSRELDRVFAENKGAQLFVTTSRRTPADVERIVEMYNWDYALIYSKDRFNPIPAFVKLAKKLYVTAESTGMLSEACTFGTAEVVALDNLKPGRHKFRRFVENLRAEGYVDGNRKVDLTDAFTRAKELLS